MFSERRVIGDDWADTTRSKWTREHASLEIDYTAYGLPDAIVGLLTDPWVDLAYDGVSNFADYQAFLNLFSAQDPKADRNADSVFNFYDVQFFLADQSAADADLTPTGRLNEEENPFGLDGYRYDAITGLYHVRNRVLDPEQGKWLQRDPAGFVDGGNTYAFAMNSPLSSADPLGLWKVVRSGAPTAAATSEDDPFDTINGLAAELGLSTLEFRNWISSHPDPTMTPNGAVPWHQIDPFEAICPNQRFSIPNTIIWFDTRNLVSQILSVRNRHRSDARELGYYLNDASGYSRQQFMDTWQLYSKAGWTYGLYLDVHSNGWGWYENRVPKTDRIKYSTMRADSKYGLALLYGALCDSDSRLKTCGMFGFVDLSSRFPRHVYAYNHSWFVPWVDDSWNAIRDYWPDPNSLQGR